MTSNTYARGWAVVDDKGLDINTVSSSERAAKVNWLLTGMRIPINGTMTNEDIEFLWTRFGVNTGRAQVVRVSAKVITDEGEENG